MDAGVLCSQGFQAHGIAWYAGFASNAACGHREQQSGSIQPTMNFPYWTADSHLGFGV